MQDILKTIDLFVLDCLSYQTKFFKEYANFCCNKECYLELSFKMFNEKYKSKLVDKNNKNYNKAVFSVVFSNYHFNENFSFLDVLDYNKNATKIQLKVAEFLFLWFLKLKYMPKIAEQTEYLKKNLDIFKEFFKR